jgi:ribonuclease HI
LPVGALLCWSDGGYTKHTNRAGWGACMLRKEAESSTLSELELALIDELWGPIETATGREFSYGAETATNNTGELMGIAQIIVRLRQEGGHDPAALFYDSEYAAQAAQSGKGKKNIALVAAVHELLIAERKRRRGGVQLMHVKSHTDDQWNDHADDLVQDGKEDGPYSQLAKDTPESYEDSVARAEARRLRQLRTEQRTAAEAEKKKEKRLRRCAAKRKMWLERRATKAAAKALRLQHCDEQRRHWATAYFTRPLSGEGLVSDRSNEVGAASTAAPCSPYSPLSPVLSLAERIKGDNYTGAARTPSRDWSDDEEDIITPGLTPRWERAPNRGYLSPLLRRLALEWETVPATPHLLVAETPERTPASPQTPQQATPTMAMEYTPVTLVPETPTTTATPLMPLTLHLCCSMEMDRE